MTGLATWVVYDHPSDQPDYFVARLWHGETPTAVVMMSTSLEALQDELEQQGLVKLYRMQGDDPVILETWL